MFTDKQQILAALLRMGRCLVLMDASEYSLLVCGGSALNLVGLLERPTRDVDVLGLVEIQRGSGTAELIVVAQELPEEINRAAASVARDLDLPEDWLNDAALDVQRLGLPPRILERAQRREFGPCLTVFVLGRQDQVALKLYAALDRLKGERHFKDLAQIRPTRAEMEFAARWLLMRKSSKQFRDAVRRTAEGLGFSNLGAFRKAAIIKAAGRPLAKEPRGTVDKIKKLIRKTRAHGGRA